MPRDDPIIERIPRRSLKKRNITPSKNELPHIGSNVAFEENMISRFNIGIARRTRDGLQHWHCKKDKRWPEYPYHAKRDSIYEGVGPRKAST
ncbi:hypothetical protein Tco_1149266 [Tanacetum coccineum]